MATKTQRRKKLSTANLKRQYNKIHDNVLDITEETVDITVDNVEKWQKLLRKVIKQSTPFVEKNIDLTFTVVETLAKQYKTGGKRMKSLLGLGGKSYKKTIPAKKITKIKTTVKSSAKTKSNLKNVTGVGPQIEKLLNAEGIRTLSDLADAKVDTLIKMLDVAGPRFQIHDPSTWINQAKSLMKG